MNLRIEERNKEIENYLSNAAGYRVIEEVLKALREGQRETTFESLIDVPIPATPGVVQRLKVKYYIHDIEANPSVPEKHLMKVRKSKQGLHTPSRGAIKVFTQLVER